MFHQSIMLSGVYINWSRGGGQGGPIFFTLIPGGTFKLCKPHNVYAICMLQFNALQLSN